MRALILVAGVMGCANMLPPVRNSGPAFSEEGVQLTVVGQTCHQSLDPVRPNNQRREVTLAIEVGNPTNFPVVIHRDRWRLVPSDSPAVRTSTGEGAETISVRTGVTAAFTLRFMPSGTSCSHEMRLEPDSAIELGGSPIKIGGVSFVPAWSP